MMSALLAPLAFVGRHGTTGFAISIFLGLALPQFAAAARPLLAITIFCFITLTFARIDLAALRALVAAPGRLMLSCVWVTLAPAVIVLAGLALIGRGALDPGLILGLALLAAAPPVMSAPAIAMILGLEPTLVFATVAITTLLAPLVAPFAVEFVAGMSVPLDRLVLVERLVWLIGGAILAGGTLRLVIGEARIRQHKQSIDGVGVVCYFLYAVAAMDGVTAAAVDRPWTVAGFLAAAALVSAAGFASASLLLGGLARADRLVLGYSTGQRNMGLLVAALGTAVPETTFLFFSLAQFPIYLMPQLMQPFARRLGTRDA